VIPPSNIISVGIGIVLGCSVETMQGISMLNGSATLGALNTYMPLHTSSPT